MKIRHILGSLSLMPILLAFASPASAVLLLGQELAPAKIFDAGNGLEWVWAAPCAGEDPSCGVVQLHHDFRFATDDEWLSSFTNLAGLIAAFDVNTMCSAPEFSTVHDHCDNVNLLGGAIWHAPAGISSGPNLSYSETFLVRGSGNRVPEPGLLGLLGLGLMGLGVARRRRLVK